MQPFEVLLAHGCGGFDCHADQRVRVALNDEIHFDLVLVSIVIETVVMVRPCGVLLQLGIDERLKKRAEQAAIRANPRRGQSLDG